MTTHNTNQCRLAKWISLALLVSLVLAATVASAVEPINQSFFGHIAIKGYDPVAYFTINKPAKGDSRYQYQWMDATWHFSSRKHRDLFSTDPAKYAPQYGGYCAYAVSQNETADIDPKQFTIHDGKLYLNYNRKINRKWLAEKEQYIKEADQHWAQRLSD